VYFQPPESVKLQYPCIIYERIIDNVEYADNYPYKKRRLYSIKVIDRNPDSIIPDKVGEIPYSSTDTSYTKNNLNHYIFNIYY